MYPDRWDVLDIGELVLATSTGEDFWGRQVTVEEKVLLGLSAILVFLPISIPAILKVFKRKVNVANTLRKAVQTAKITSEERALLKEAEETITKGGKATKEQLEALSNILKRMPNEYPPIELLLRGTTGRIPGLQGGKVKAGEGPTLSQRLGNGQYYWQV